MKGYLLLPMRFEWHVRSSVRSAWPKKSAILHLFVYIYLCAEFEHQLSQGAHAPSLVSTRLHLFVFKSFARRVLVSKTWQLWPQVLKPGLFLLSWDILG